MEPKFEIDEIVRFNGKLITTGGEINIPPQNMKIAEIDSYSEFPYYLVELEYGSGNCYVDETSIEKLED